MPLCFVAPAPLLVDGIHENEREKRVLLSTDQVHGRLWSSLSQANFARTCDLWETAGREREPPYFGWLSTALPGYPETVSPKLIVRTQPVGMRPRIEVQPQEHPLYRDQLEGIPWDRACELSHAAFPEGATRR